MTGILLLATVILSVLLYDTRRRLIRLEGLLVAPPAPAHTALEGPARHEHFEAETPSIADFQLDPVAEFVPIAPEPMSIAEEAEPEPKLVADLDDKTASSGFGFEDLFGRKLSIWAGGITLIVAAVLMVKYSIDTGLLSPVVRVVMGLVFGGVLIGLGELAHRREDVVRDVRVAQALVGAGVGGLYASVLALPISIIWSVRARLSSV